MMTRWKGANVLKDVRLKKAFVQRLEESMTMVPLLTITTAEIRDAATVLRVPGDPVGYTRMTGRGKWSARARRYHAYMIEVQVAARKAGIKLPLTATEAAPLRIDVYCTFRNRRHADPENVRKACVDAMFYGGAGDKYCFGYHAAPRYVGNVPDGETGVVVIIGATEILR